jgi:hypothetical protein
LVTDPHRASSTSEQVDTPRTLYHEPGNLFVAGFIGSPAMNLVPFCDRRGCRVQRRCTAALRLGAVAGLAGDRVIVGFRPEAVTLGDGTLKGITRVVEDLGVGGVRPSGRRPRWGHGVDRGEPGEPVPVRVTGAIHLFDPAGRRWRRRCPDARPRLGRWRVQVGGILA